MRIFRFSSESTATSYFITKILKTLDKEQMLLNILHSGSSYSAPKIFCDTTGNSVSQANLIKEIFEVFA